MIIPHQATASTHASTWLVECRLVRKLFRLKRHFTDRRWLVDKPTYDDMYHDVQHNWAGMHQTEMKR